ncbi:iron ABC transporter substrate-binding protein [Fictibacillus arsenicus]|uniref:Iron ABC transporter substrate-binding protein n=1 Tax=Fictibacillus arsenicus TaxID=255247 RepID=A0A1B1Z7Z2_9BACL|nr:ABC transporter substrate-binding protein [Fictibacillus arsenicus]ANX13554.1 iron ABC transporter substrate-binding protein [Fictibacillus arsenicus]
MKRLLTIWFTLMLVIGVIAGCSAEKTSTSEKASENSNVHTEFPVSITDDTGEKITIEKKPDRIVSLVPSNTEIAFALGLENEIVGVSDFDNYPEAALKKEKIGDMEFNVEKIIGLKPDIVLAHASGGESAKPGLTQLKDAGITVLVVKDATNFEDTYATIEMIAKATGTEKEGQKIIQSMKADLKEIKDRAKHVKEKKKVWVEVSPEPEIFTTGKGTFIDEMLNAIHATNAAGDQQGWVKVTEEEAINYNPEVVITTYGYYVENAKEQVMKRSAWKDVSAVKNEQVFDVHSDKVTRPGPRLIEGVKELAEAIYPDVFTE